MVSVQSRAAEREIRFTSRVKRVGGILGFLKDLLVGGNDVEKEIDEMQSAEEIKYKRILSTIITVNEKSKELEQKFKDKSDNLLSNIMQANSEQQDISTKLHIVELILLAHQVIDNISEKYRMLRTSPIQEEELEILYNQIEKELPETVRIIRTHPSFSIEEREQSLAIILKTILVETIPFEVFQAYPVPDRASNSIIVIEKNENSSE